jgi:catechol 2,3-dioxygenase-like lactoylglutathione lyase family enzyme
MILGIEHIAIFSPHPHELAEWYVKTLGFAVSMSNAETVFVRSQNGVVFEITTADCASSAQPLKAPGLRHIAIGVNDFDSIYQRLREVGVRFEGEPFAAGENRVVFFTDPEGNYLHLIHRPTPLP